MFNPNHLHLLVKGYLLNPPIQEEELNQWFIQLVEKVRMKVVSGPMSVYVHEEGNEGLTGCVSLATSHSSFHCWSKETPSLFQFDLYSCSCFTPEEVLEHLDKFGLITHEWIFIDRNGEMKIINSGKSSE
jgi:S-adenosylmethionine/arginine decarboxylase-like enzyme